MKNLKNKIEKLTILEIQEQLFVFARKKTTQAENLVWRAMFEVLEGRLNDDEFDYFLDQLDAVELAA